MVVGPAAPGTPAAEVAPGTLAEQLADTVTRRDAMAALTRALEREDERALLCAFLREGPTDPATGRDYADNAPFRALFELVAPHLPAGEAWAIAASAIERVGDGDLGSITRYAVRRAALPRWAREVGAEALPEILGALSEDAPTGLDALLALASHAELDRVRVLAELRPYFGHRNLRAHAAHAAAAIGALTPDVPPASLGLPREIERAWADATLTEGHVAGWLVEHGLLTSATSLAAPPAWAIRLWGRALVVDVLVRAKVAAAFDTESGFAPVPYVELFERELLPLARSLAGTTVRVSTTPAGDGFRYALALQLGSASVRDSFEDASDDYDVRRALTLVNGLLEARADAARMQRLTTDDTSALVVCAPPKVATKLCRAFGLKLAARR